MSTALSDAGIAPANWMAPTTEALVRSRTDLPVVDRLAIYHYAYRARLIDCLADDYPTVRHALGAAGFERLCATVIRLRPSRRPNLNFYGLALLEHCRDQRFEVPHHAFIRELAAFEWAMTEVFHAQAAPALSLDTLRRIPMERWNSVTFTPNATVRIIRSIYPVNAYVQAFREDLAPTIPKRAWSSTVIFRSGWHLSRMDLARPMDGLLDRLFAGQQLGVALDALPAGTEGPQVMRWFTEWVSGGLFATVSM
ncbi:MAG: putative DNA-binding domain-containing protein [Planctomycetes bacterium]|nr:putative DNA-binding domain-containing protein [Planctomycetota bacterium]